MTAGRMGSTTAGAAASLARGDDGFHGVGKAEVLELLLTVWSLLLLNSGNQSKG